MFAYNSSNDQYEEVLTSDEDYFTNEKINSISHATIIARPRSRLSSQRSVRSLREKIPYLTRIVSKSGRLNTLLTKLPKKNLRYFRDLGNTLLHIQWRWILLTLCVVNFLFFLLFGFLLMWISHLSGDNDKNKVRPCIINVKNFYSYFLLSVETIMTIGYGTRYPTENCKQVWVLHVLQALINVVMQGVVVSAVYVKITKPFTKKASRLFSKKAVIHLRDGEFCFIFRIDAPTGKITSGTKISIYFIDKNCFYETNQFLMKQMEIEHYGELIFPTEIIHVINKDSPLWNYTPYQLLTLRYEIVAVAEGTSIITGQTSQNKTSYVNSDIMWGHKFEECIHFDEYSMKYIIDHKKINKTLMIDSPLCSAKDLEHIRKSIRENINN